MSFLVPIDYESKNFKIFPKTLLIVEKNVSKNFWFFIQFRASE